MKTNFLLNLMGRQESPKGKQHSRFDSVSLVSRQSVLAIILLCLTLGVGNAWGETVTINSDNIGTFGWNTTQGSQTGSTGGITITSDNGARNSTTQMRFYSGGVHTFTSSVGNITKVEFTCTASGTSNYGPGKMSLQPGSAGSYSYSGTTGTWTGNAASFTLTGGQSRCTSIVITYTAAAGPTLTTSSSMTTLTYSAGSPVAQSFTIGGSNLTSNVTVTAPTDYEVCKTENGTYASSVSFTNTEVNAADKTVYIRLQSGLSAGNIASRNITVASSGADSKTIAVTGSVPYTITWMANGSTFTTTYVAVGSTLALPVSDPDPSTYSCDGKTFYGWYGAGSSYSNPSAAPAIAAAGDAVSADKTYYAVFGTLTGGGASGWLLCSTTDDVTAGTYVITWDNSYYLPSETTAASNPAVGSGITVSNNKLSNTVTSAMQWTFTGNNTDGFTISHTSGSSYVLESTNAAQGISVKYLAQASGVTWTASVDGTYGMLLRGSDGGTRNLAVYNSGSWRYYATGANYTGTLRLYKYSSGGTWSDYETSCAACTAPTSLSIAATGSKWDYCAGESMTLTVSGSNISGSATYLWKVSHDGGANYSDAPGTNNAATYTVASMTAANAGKYTCTVSNGSCNATTSGYDVKVWTVYINNGAAGAWQSIPFTNTGTGTGTANVTLESDASYGFKLWNNLTSSTDFYGLNSKTITGTESNITLNSSGANVGINSGLGGTYVFSINYTSATSPKVSVTYPSANQDAGNLVYWDASIHGDDWTNLYFRVGTSSNANANASNCKIDGNLVPGTDKFYKIPTVSFTGMDVWAIANNKGWTGTNTNGVYKTKTGDGYAITKSTEYQDYIVGASGVTLIPASSGSVGSQSHDNNCTFYPVTKTDGMLTHNVSVGSADHGTLVATYTNTSGTTGQTVTEGNNADLAHRCILTITATPENANYEVKTLTVNGVAFTSGNTHILSADATIAATFGLKDATITLENYSGSATTTGYHASESFTLPSTNSFICEDKTFVGWSTVAVATTDTKPSSNFYEPGASVTLAASNTFYAVYATSSGGGGGSNEYELVTDASTLSDGDQILIVSPAGTVKSSGVDYDYGAKALSTSVCGTTRLCGEDVTIDGTTITTTTATVFTLSGNSSDGWKIYNGSDYLYADAKNKLSTTTTVGDALVFPITIAASDPYKATIGNVTLGSDACHLDFNPSVSAGVVNPYFALYTSNYKGVYIYKSSGATYSAYSTSCGTVYELTFKETDGTNNGSGKVVENATSFSYVSAPTKAGYSVEGFYKESSLTNKIANSDRTFCASTAYTNGSSQYTANDDHDLYIKWEVQHYTITYDKGENGTGTIAAGDKTHGVSFTLSSSTFTRDGYTQDGWSTSDGGDKVYDLGGSYTANADITLYPHWAISNYTIGWEANGTDWTGASHGNPSTAADYNTKPATIPTAPVAADCDDSKVFVGWTNAPYEDDDTAPTVLFTSQSGAPAITGNTTFYAVFATQSGSSTDWELVTSSSDALADGDDIIIASSGSAGSAYALGYQNTNNRGAVSVTIASGPKISSPTLATTTSNTTDIYPLKLVANGDYFNIKDVLHDLFLASTSNDNARLKRLADGNDDKAKFTISVNASGVASLTVKSTDVYRYLRYNSGSTLFSCYSTSGAQSAVYIYRKSVSYADYTTSCCNQPLTQLSISADKTELESSGTAEITLTGGNGKNITWSCRDEADVNCDALLTATSNSGATLTISSPVATTKTYVVKAVQPEDDDDAEHIVCGKTVSIEITVKTQWTITFQTTDEGTPITYETQTVTDGESYIFPDLSDDYTCETNYSFAGWKEANTAGAPEYAAGSSATASNNKTWYAVWMQSNGTTTETRDKYELITSTSTAIAENDVVVIACSSQGVALRQMTTTDKYGSPVAVDFADNKSYLTFASGTNVMELKLESRAGGYWYFTDNNSDDIYINYNGSGGSLIYDDEYRWYWSISFNDAGTATISDPEEGYTDFKIQYKSDNTRFAFYSGTGSVYKNVQLYRKNGTISVSVPNAPDYYVNNEHCDGGATIRATNNQWVTSSKDQKVRITIPVTAKNFTNSDRSMTASSDNDHFTVSIPSTTIPSGSTGLTTNLTVEYTPVAANTTEEANITITTGTGTDHATKVITVNGRSLPDEFVIATQKEGKWYALPADMFNGSDTYTPITVTPNAGPTKIPSAPYTTIYSAREVATSRYETAGNCMRLVGNSNKCLWANNSTNNSHIQNWATLSSTNGSQYEWLLTTTDGEQYTIANPAHPDYATGRQLAIYTLKFGLYKADAVFYLLPVDCSTQPGNVQITPRRVDATFSWETNASTVTIDLYTNEGMTEGHKTASVTDVPYLFSGLAENTQYWYKLTPDADDDCAVTGTFSTSGPTIDVVEWGENSATIYVDKDEAVDPRIIIAGEVEHGQGGIVATDIFFSKYFEAEGTAKLLAIYNGTANAISLADITILQRTSAKNTPLSLASYGKTAGWIQPGEEIVLFNRDSRAAVMECAENNETYDSWINVEDNNLSFSGKGTIRLFRGNTCIDIIGAMNAGDNAANMNDKTRDPMEGAGTPSFGDANGFVTLYGDNYETPAEETDYELSTNRCLLIRRAFVTSGDSALLNNFGDFKTLGTYTGVDSKTHKGEWSGLQIPTAVPPETDYIHTCEGFEDAGSFDYNKYYKEFSTISDNKYLSDFTRADDGTYTLPIEYMRQYACMNLKFQLTAHNDPTDVLTEQLVQVPIVVKDARNTNDTLFNNIIKQDVEPHAPMVAESINRCKTCNVVVLGTGTLTKVADGSTNDVAEMYDVKVYPGGKLIVPANTHYVVNSLALRREEDLVSSAKISSGLSADPDDIAEKGIYIRHPNGVYLDVRIDPSNWHYITLPYDCRVGDIRFVDGTPAKVNTDYLISWYDGAYRAEHKDGGWTDITSDDYVLKAGLGYIVALPGDGLVKRELRFPMANDVIDAELGNKIVRGLYAYGGDKTDEELRPNHKGWNMIGNPYLYDYTTDIIKSPLAQGELEHDPDGSSWNGKWVRTGDARYIVAPINNGWSGYEQTTIGNMKPFMSYFIQIGTTTDGTDNPETERSITFNLSSKASIVRRAQAEATEPMYPVWYGVELQAPNGEKDNTTLLISDEFTDGYDMMSDLVKMRGSYYTYYQYPVLASRNNEGEMAFNALPDSSAAVIGVPLNFYAAQAGMHTFATDSRFDLEEVKSAMLYDATTAQYYNLLEDNHSFNLTKGNNTNRFTLFVRVERKKAPNPETDVDNLLADGQLSLIAIDKTLVLSGLTDAANVYVYDISGKLINSDRTNGGIWRTSVPATGVYFVRVNSINGQQTLRTIVK